MVFGRGTRGRRCGGRRTAAPERRWALRRQAINDGAAVQCTAGVEPAYDGYETEWADAGAQAEGF